MGILKSLALRKADVFMLSLSFLLGSLCVTTAEARSHHKSSQSHSSTKASSSKSSKHSKHHHTEKVATKPRYAYPLDFFMMHPPEFDSSELPPDEAQRIRTAFENGTADRVTPAQLVRAGATHYHALRGGIFKRREDVKYIVVHSTETGVPQEARRVIDSWSGLGIRHAGAQFVVDRDGTIWQACDPELATVHVNIFKTLPGINNDNTVGIEMCHAGSQTYPPEQRQSVIRLVSYLQDRYKVLNENIITHRYAQQGDHTDPVAFDWDGFLNSQSAFHNKALAMKRDTGSFSAEDYADGAELPVASVFLEMHKAIPLQQYLNRRTISATETPRAERQLRSATTAQTDAVPASQKRPNFLDAPNNSAPTMPSSKNASIRGEIELPPNSASDARNQ